MCGGQRINLAVIPQILTIFFILTQSLSLVWNPPSKLCSLTSKVESFSVPTFPVLG